jgi:hypothetical protein
VSAMRVLLLVLSWYTIVLTSIYIFLAHVPIIGNMNQTSFEEMYLVVPTAVLRTNALEKEG